MMNHTPRPKTPSARRHPWLLGVFFALFAFFAVNPSGTLSGAVPFPLGFWKPASAADTELSFPNDSFESYTSNASVNALDGGGHWNGSYVDRFAPTGIYEQDDFEGYADAAVVSGLNGGNLGWNGAYVDRENPFGLKSSDDLEGYSDGASVDALNGGSGWNGAFVDR